MPSTKISTMMAVNGDQQTVGQTQSEHVLQKAKDNKNNNNNNTGKKRAGGKMTRSHRPQPLVLHKSLVTNINNRKPNVGSDPSLPTIHERPQSPPFLSPTPVPASPSDSTGSATPSFFQLKVAGMEPGQKRRYLMRRMLSVDSEDTDSLSSGESDVSTATARLRRRLRPRKKTHLRSWCATFTVYLLYVLSLAAGVFNVLMILPNEALLYVSSARAYQLVLSIAIYAGMFMSLYYLFERREKAVRRDEPVPVSNVLLLVIIAMALFAAFGFALYFIPFVFVFWDCDAVLSTVNDFDKYSDIVFYLGSCVYVLVIIVYSLQRCRLESDKESGIRHDFEHVLKAFNSVVIALLFIKIVVDKIYVVYRDMICPHITHHHYFIGFGTERNSSSLRHEYRVDRPGIDQDDDVHYRLRRAATEPLNRTADDDSGLKLGICDGIPHWQCDMYSLHNMAKFYTTLDRKVFRPLLYVIAAELMPLIFTLHRNSTSGHHGHKTRPESPVARFSFPEVRPWVINVVFRGWIFAAINLFFGIVGYRMYLFGAYIATGPSRGIPTIDAISTLYNVFRVALFGAIFWTVFRENPRRYQPDSNAVRRWCRPKIRKSFRTPLMHHAEFDTAVIYFCLFVKVVMVLADTTIVTSNGIFNWFDLASITQLVAMVVEWLVLREMLVLNDSELSAWPLSVNRQALSLGALICAAGMSFGYLSFIDEFVKHVSDKISLSDVSAETSSYMLLSFLACESLYFAVSLYYFTLATCWLELFYRYAVLGVFTLGDIRQKRVSGGDAKGPRNRGFSLQSP